jgi:crotonobetainyl-CoA:carnitine CoA-transferase CaiB-like acyl-CoA transferase
VRIAPQLDNERFATDALRRKNGDALSGELERIMKTRSASEWIALCEANDVPVDIAVTPAEAARHPQLVERQATERGYAKFPVWANARRGGRIARRTPKLGEHSREILVELGFDDAEIAALVRTGGVGAG